MEFVAGCPGGREQPIALHNAFLEQEARIQQLLDTKFEEHLSRVAELLTAQLAEFRERLVRTSTAEDAPCPKRCSYGSATARNKREDRAVRSSVDSSVTNTSAFFRCSLDSDRTEEWFNNECKNVWGGSRDAGRFLKRKAGNIYKRNSFFARAEPSKSWVLSVYASQWFELCLAILIVANSISIGVFAEWSMEHFDEPVPLWFNIANWFFASAFSVEIVIRGLAEGKWFLSPGNIDLWWNMFDLVLVFLGLVEEALRLFGISTHKTSFVRLARILRLVKALRLVRLLKFFKELRVMVSGIMQCAKPLAWACLLLGMISYIFVVFLLQVCAVWLDDNFSDPEQRLEAADITIGDHFPSLLWGMYTMFQSISGGLSWSEVADGLVKISPVVVLAFCMYIVVSIFCVCNVITSVFLEAAHTRNVDPEAIVLEHMQSKQQWMKEAKDFVDALLQEGQIAASDEDGPPVISRAMFEALLQLPRTKAFFQEQGLDIYFEKPKAVFELMDVDHSGTIDINEFIAGLHRLKGSVRSLDMHLEMRHTMRLIDKLRELSLKNYEILRSLGSGFSNSGGGCDAPRSHGHEHHAKPPVPEASRTLFAAVN